jgi:predicted transcriptional regulator
MSLKLNDLLKKAEQKGISKKFAAPSSTELLRTWQQESVLFTSEKLEPNLGQSRAKLEPNLSQTEAKLEPNLGQSRAKLEPSRSKLEPKVEPKLSQTWAKVKPNLGQSRAKLEPKDKIFNIIGLPELQKRVIFYIHEICQTLLERETQALPIRVIAIDCESTVSAVRKALQRLEEMGTIQRIEYKDGRGGWTRYGFPDQIYQEILRLKNQKVEPNLGQSRAKLEPNLSQTWAKLRTELRTELEPSPSSSSSLDIKTTTTSAELSDEWKFDIASYSRFGFTQTQLKQIASLGVISSLEVEQSLIEFSHDLDNNMLPPIKTTKINLLMGLLRSGHAYVSESFKNEQETMIAEMARRAEAKRKKLIEEKFGAWEGSLKDEERKLVLNKLPTSLMVLEKTYGIGNEQVKNWYLDYFMKNVKE